MDTTSTIAANFRKLRRRPLFTPLLVPVVLLGILLAAGIWALDARQSPVIIVVRHAEIDGGSDPNPPLNPTGKARAAALQQLLSKVKPDRGLDAIYVTEKLPAQQTAAPVADSMGLVLNLTPRDSWADLPTKIRRNHAGEVVLVVADATGMQALLDAYQPHDGNALQVDAEDAGAVYVITAAHLSKPTVIRLRY